MFNGTGKESVSFIYLIIYLNESFLPYNSNNTNQQHSSSNIYFINTNCFLFLWNTFLLIHCLPKIKAFCSIFIQLKDTKIKILYVDFFALQ